MSADDFQTKYASVMESMLKGAVAETTKLFETMVDELKAEISVIKKENEDLKTKCRQFEKAKSQPTVHTVESEPLPRPRDCSEKRDTAVQCDLVPFRTMLVEQCQPLRHSTQEQQYSYKDTCLQKDQNYEEGNCPVPLVKEEEEVDPTVVYRQTLSDNADSPRASACGTEKEVLLINKERSNREITLLQKDEETRAVMEVLCLGIDSNLQGAQKQLSEPEHSQVISLTGKQYDMEEDSSVGLKISEIRTQGKLVKCAEQPSVAAKQLSEVESHKKEQPSLGETSNEQTYDTVQQYTGVHSTEKQFAEPKPLNKEGAYGQLEGGSTKAATSSKPVLPVCRRRGRPPKKAKCLQRPVQKQLASLSTDVPTDQEVLPAPSTEVSSANETLNTPPAESIQAPSVQTRERCTSVTLQDAMLLVEAMNQSTEKNAPSSLQGMVSPQIQCVPHVGTLKTVDEVPAQLPAPESPTQTPPLPLVTCKVAEHHATEMSTTTKSKAETPCDTSWTKDATKTIKAQSHIKTVIPQQLQADTTSNNSSCPSSSTDATQTSVSLQQRPPHPLITLAVPSKSLSNIVQNRIIIVPRSSCLRKPLTITALSPAKNSTVASTVAAAQNICSLPVSTVAGLPLGTPSLSSVSQKATYATSKRQVATSQTAASSTHQQSAILPKITIIIPRHKKPSQETPVLTRKQESAEPGPTVKVSSPLLVYSSQQISISQMASDQQASTSVGLMPITVSPDAPLATEQKLSAVVKLSRLPFPMSTRESVLISRLPLDVFSGGTMQEKPSSEVKSTQPSKKVISLSEVPALSTDIAPNLKETSVTVSVRASQIIGEPNDIHDKALLSSETCTILDKPPAKSCVQPSSPSKMSASVLKKLTGAVSITESSAVSGTASEPTSDLDEDIISSAMPDYLLPDDPPVQDKESAALIQLTSFTSKDIVDPHLQMTKTQFLARLAVSPVVEAPEKASTNDFADARASCAETSAVEKRELQKNSLVARLRSHLKTHLQARRTERSPQLLTETETSPVSPKKCSLEKVSQKVRNTPGEPIPVSPKKTDVDDVTSRKNITDDPTTISPRGSGLCKDDFRSMKTVSETSCVRSKLSKNKPGLKSLTTPKRSSFARDDVDPENTKSTSLSPRRSSSNNNGVPKKIQFSHVCSRRSCSTRDCANTKKTKTTSKSPRRCISAKGNASPKKTQSTTLSPRRTTSTTVGATPKNSKRMYSNTTDGGEIGTSARWPYLAKDSSSPVKTRESTPAKKPRFIKDPTISKTSLRLVNAKKLAKAAKAKKLAKMKNSNQSILQNEAKTSHLAKNVPNCETVRRCTSKAVWFPPVMPVSETTSLEGKNSSLLPVKKEASSPGSKNHIIVYPTVRGPPIVSPSQPLLVIGRCLLKNQCGECGRVLSSSAALESHVSCHTGHRPFSCTLCGKSFPDSKGFKRHGRVHRNGRIHICQHCGKGFVYRFGLTKHLQMVHGRIKPFVCQICNKAFFAKRDVETHIRIHTGEKPFPCNLCERRFARRVELNVHLRWHNGEKRHWCPYCGKGFLDSNNLKRHKYIHTGEKPHSCPHCSKNFTQSGHLKKHVKNVHKIK
ncbi:uncharacterized protein LOC128374442 isoform X2 [Scomber japonicus]|uniref:uncharacterized protein LOC128374442 isoform X2 n=1 Tax=Scomber japonicus TaxID=13676 RepID=UPI00230692A5|nr:uncharacterized protein LOC128374442 isoform X2 [Scomber japonicus]